MGFIRDIDKIVRFVIKRQTLFSTTFAERL